MRGFLHIFSRRILLACYGLSTNSHSHYTASIILSPESEFAIETPERTIRSRGMIIAPNTMHSLHADGIRTVVLQLARDTDTFGLVSDELEQRRIQTITEEKMKSVDALLDSLYHAMKCEKALGIFQSLVVSLTGSSGELPAIRDQRILDVLAWIDEELPEPISTGQLAELAKLSVDRFMHIFKDTMGLPVRRYLLWARLERAALALEKGGSLTGAAHAAGFSDSAHLSRTFREMFGIRPSDIFLESAEGSLEVNFCLNR